MGDPVLPLSLRHPDDSTGDHPHPHRTPLLAPLHHPAYLLSEAGRDDAAGGGGGAVASEHLGTRGKASRRISLTPRSIGDTTTDDDADLTPHASNRGPEGPEGEDTEEEEQRVMALMGHDAMTVQESDGDGLHMMASIRKRFSELMSMGRCCCSCLFCVAVRCVCHNRCLI